MPNANEIRAHAHSTRQTESGECKGQLNRQNHPHEHEGPGVTRSSDMGGPQAAQNSDVVAPINREGGRNTEEAAAAGRWCSVYHFSFPTRPFA